METGLSLERLMHVSWCVDRTGGDTSDDRIKSIHRLMLRMHVKHQGRDYSAWLPASNFSSFFFYRKKASKFRELWRRVQVPSSTQKRCVFYLCVKALGSQLFCWAVLYLTTPSVVFPDVERRTRSGHPHRVFSVSGPCGPPHHGDGPAPLVSQLFPESPACLAGAGRPLASPLEALHCCYGEWGLAHGRFL